MSDWNKLAFETKKEICMERINQKCNIFCSNSIFKARCMTLCRAEEQLDICLNIRNPCAFIAVGLTPNDYNKK
jgi:hypothetical protein